MPITDRERFDAALGAVLVDRAGGADAQGVAKATLGLLQQIDARLVPLIGVLGVNALLGRALHLTSRRFAWLHGVGGSADGGVPLALKVRLAEQSPAVAVEAGHALLFSFTELLADLIGDSLTERLLAPIWAPVDAKLENARWTTK